MEYAGDYGSMPVRPVGAPTVDTTFPTSRRYKIECVQQPVRARMCGFGDKDRRPITPPPCVRLRVYDENNHEVSANDINCDFFVLAVDLWSQDGQQQVSLVKHSSNSPAMSISAATTTSFPPPQDRIYAFIQAPHLTMSSNGMPTNVISMVPVVPTAPSYGSAPGYPATSYAGPSYQTAMSNPAAAVVPSYNNYPQQQPTTQPYGYPVSVPLHAMPVSTTATSGQHTRNLIGSLAVSAAKLNDENGEMGIWFVLQDLSVRTEGIFRLRFAFVDVSDPQQPTEPTKSSTPILATAYSDVFQVYSAKKFPGVIESTPLSKAFALQGVKIPIRKDIKQIANADDYARDNDDPASA